jgi:hypothetical protein
MMRSSTLLLSLAAVCAVVVPIEALAQQAAPPAAQSDESLTQVQVSGQARRHRLDASEARAVAGTYAMSNGWTMHVVPHVNEVRVSINDGAPITLIAQTSSRFASADGNIDTVFNQGPWQEDVTMSYVPEGALSAQRVVIGSAPLAAK